MEIVKVLAWRSASAMTWCQRLSLTAPRLARLALTSAACADSVTPRLDATLPHPVLQRPIEHGVEQATAGDGGEEPRRGLLEGREVGHGLRVDEPAEIGMVLEVLGQAAVVEARELLEDQAGQELGLGELPEAELVRVLGHRPEGRLAGDPEHPARGFAGLHTS
jgi:hypothetical protein